MEKIFKTYKKNVKVYVQILQPVPLSWDYVKVHEDFTTLYIRSSQDFGKGNIHKVANYRIFETDGILYKMFQDEIFELCVKGTLYKVLLGVDLLVFAFGQTGSGKSSTVHGLLNIYENRGLSPRIIAELFDMKENYKKEMDIKFSISFIEIYRNSIIDLLSKNSKKLLLSAKNIKIVNVALEKDALKLLFQGESNRNVYQNNTYISHLATTVFTIHIRSISTIISKPTENYAQLHIIDMAGIDSGGNKSCTLKKPLDIGLANLNKSQLEQCLLAIQKDLILEKQSIKDAGLLVQYLGKSLGPHSNIRFIGHISTSFENLHVTLSCLKFSDIARRIRPAKLKPTSVNSADLELSKVKYELEKIKEKQYLDSMLLNDDFRMRLSEPRNKQMEHIVEEYINKKTNELTVINLTDLKHALSVFRLMYDRLNTELRESMYEAALATIRAEEKASIKSGARKSSKSLSQSSQLIPPVIEERLERPSSKSISHDDHKRSKSLTEKTSKIYKSSKHNKIFNRRSNKLSRSDGKEAKPSIIKSGLSLETIMQHNYTGDKSMRLNPKIFQQNIIEKVMNQLNKTFAGNINLEETFENKDIIWNNYIIDSTYDFQRLNTAKEKIEMESINLLNNYEFTLNTIQNKVQLIDITREDISKIEFFENIKNVTKCGPPDEVELNKRKEILSAKIPSLKDGLPHLQEELLSLQAELQINVGEYNRLKLCITNNFTDYCINKFHLPSPPDQITEVLQDKLTVSDVKPIQKKKDDSKNKERKHIFNALQINLNKVFCKRFPGLSIK